MVNFNVKTNPLEHVKCYKLVDIINDQDFRIFNMISWLLINDIQIDYWLLIT